jgi:hypothetical protein
MRKPGGQVTITGGGVGPTSDPGLQSLNRYKEADTFTCVHCQKVTVVPVRSRPEDIGGLCRQCYGLICPSCVGKACRPFEKWLEEVERNVERNRAINEYFR